MQHPDLIELGEANSTPSPSPTIQTRIMDSQHAGEDRTAHSRTRHYATSDLRRIGDLCRARLPPASAIHGIFQYQLACQSENEELFHSILLNLVRKETTTDGHAARIGDLEISVKTLRTQQLGKDVDARLAASSIRMDQLHFLLDERKTEAENLTKRVHALEEDVKITRERNTSATTDLLPTTTTTSSTLPRKDLDLGKLLAHVVRADHEIGILYDERDGMVSIIRGLEARLTTCEAKLQGAELKNVALELQSHTIEAQIPALETKISTLQAAAEKAERNAAEMADRGLHNALALTRLERLLDTLGIKAAVSWSRPQISSSDC